MKMEFEPSLSKEDAMAKLKSDLRAYRAREPASTQLLPTVALVEPNFRTACIFFPPDHPSLAKK